MSNSKFDNTESASSLARLVAGLGVVLGVTSINLHAATPPAGAVPIQETQPSTVTQGKVDPSGGLVVHRSLPQQPAASAVQGKIAPRVSAVARQAKPGLPITAPIRTRSIPNASATQQKLPATTVKQGKIAPSADAPVK